MSFERRILHHGPDPHGIPQLISLTAMRSCWFELHRQGGCGSAQLVLSDDFEQRNLIDLGDWISLEYGAGDRWYLGRVEERIADFPAKIRYRLEGMAVELNQIFPGGFGLTADGRNPHRYAAADLFPDDPDRDQETIDLAGTAEAVVRLLMAQYVVPGSHIQSVPDRIESPLLPSPISSLKVRGEESVRSLMKDLAMRAQSASWGVDAQGEFFFLQPRTALQASFREQHDLTRLSETRDLELLFNRILLTGDYVYDRAETSADVARKVYRWRGSYYEPTSCLQFGDRRLKIWLPWIRTAADSRAFAREFFRTYSQPARRFLIETTGQNTLPLPWLGPVQLLNRDGEELTRTRIETLRVLFDHVPRFRMELGPEDPRALWPEPPQDERWELPNQALSGGGVVTYPSDLPHSSEGGGGGRSSGTSETTSLSEFSSDDSEGSEGSSGSEGSTGSGSDDPHTGSSGSEYSTGSSGSESEVSSADSMHSMSSQGSVDSVGSLDSSQRDSSLRSEESGESIGSSGSEGFSLSEGSSASEGSSSFASSEDSDASSGSEGSAPDSSDDDRSASLSSGSGEPSESGSDSSMDSRGSGDDFSLGTSQSGSGSGSRSSEESTEGSNGSSESSSAMTLIIEDH